jgi:hypothetical protein
MIALNYSDYYNILVFLLKLCVFKIKVFTIRYFWGVSEGVMEELLFSIGLRNRTSF